ncbi:hypothetical protein AMTRI_Chr01g105060 [Amborella trichopoda]
MDPTNNENQFKKRVFLFDAPRDLQPILCFNIITWSKRYNLFPILSCLIGPSLCDFRISLSNGLFSPVGIGGSIPSLEPYLRVSYLIRLSSQLFWRSILIYCI